VRLDGAINLYAEGMGFKKPSFGHHSGGGHHGHGLKKGGKWSHVKNHALRSPTQAAWSTDAEQALRVPTQASGTSEGATKGWDARGRGRANGKTFLHKGFHETLTKLGYEHQHTDFATGKGALANVPNSQYYNPKSGRAVNVTEDGTWDSHRMDNIWKKERGSNPGEFFQKYHMKKKE
jgi:hypothetical protein